MVFLINKKYETSLDKHLVQYEYVKTKDKCYIRQKYPDRKYPIYRLETSTDSMNHNLLFTLTLETEPENREIKEDLLVFHKGTAIQEELARITQTLTS